MHGILCRLAMQCSTMQFNAMHCINIRVCQRMSVCAYIYIYVYIYISMCIDDYIRVLTQIIPKHFQKVATVATS